MKGDDGLSQWRKDPVSSRRDTFVSSWQQGSSLGFGTELQSSFPKFTLSDFVLRAFPSLSLFCCWLGLTSTGTTHRHLSSPLHTLALLSWCWPVCACRRDRLLSPRAWSRWSVSDRSPPRRDPPSLTPGRSDRVGENW